MSIVEASKPAPQDGLLGSVRRALKVLEIVAAAGDGIPAKAIARRAGFTLSATYHLLRTLVYEGYLVHLPNSRGYGLGYKVSGLHLALHRELAGTARVNDALMAAHLQAGVAMYFTTIRDDAHLVVADVVDSPEARRAQPLDVGFHEAGHASAYGKLLLAYMPEADRREYLASFGLRAITEKTVTHAGELEQELVEVRERGVAVEVEQFQPDLACVAAPVRSATGAVIAAIAASAPLAYFTQNRERITAAVQAAAASV
jgi:DNA-binding IclR family transcriptional regulator